MLTCDTQIRTMPAWFGIVDLTRLRSDFSADLEFLEILLWHLELSIETARSQLYIACLQWARRLVILEW